ncbi:ANTAR domain-containing response regulator [Sodalis sp. RH21]|uniref:ANTAR domain-containing response regulator n=1 Tax=unclassified Sodalis (in: enterobacteria) TaxID=2636512 RepID=UPI0039B580CB
MHPDDSRTSITARLLSRGMRVVVLHPHDEDGKTLTDHLRRMGLMVRAFWPIPDESPADADLIFLALQPDRRESDVPWLAQSAIPLVAVITYENPTFIDQALKLGARATINTPIRVSGLLSAIIFALHLSQQARQLTDRVDRLEKKILGLRQVSEAKTILMHMHGIGEEQAYEILRQQAMDKRITIEDISRSLIQANDIFSLTSPAAKTGGKNKEG